MKKFVARSLVFFCAAFVLLSLTVLVFSITPADHSSSDRILFSVKRGEGFSSVARRLEREGLIRSALLFRLLALTRRGDVIHFGEYELSPSMMPKTILEFLCKGRVKKYKITIPEGFNMYQVASVLDAAGICKRDDFLKFARDRVFLSKIGVPGSTVEGFLFPDTYYFSKSEGCRGVISGMVENFFKNFTPRMRVRMKEMNLTLLELVTLASIIEKETAVPQERRLISAVFHNRLRRGMRLQADPTVIYGLLPDFDGNLKRRDLESWTPYNTYRIRGLPPGPIANPGRDSIEAALYPAQSSALYFVSRNDGTHVFSSTLREHNINVAKYQKMRVKRLR